jgi:hypothetical protein
MGTAGDEPKLAGGKRAPGAPLLLDPFCNVITLHLSTAGKRHWRQSNSIRTKSGSMTDRIAV